MTDKQFEELPTNWTTQKTNKSFQIYRLTKYMSKKIAKTKGEGGIIGVTENASSLQK